MSSLSLNSSSFSRPGTSFSSSPSISSSSSRPGTSSKYEHHFRIPKHTIRNDAYGERILSESTNLYLTHDRQNEGRLSPSANLYQSHNPPLDEYLKLMLRNTKKELKIRYDQMKSSSSSSSDFLFKKHNEQLIIKSKELKQLLHNYYINNPSPEDKKKLKPYKAPFSSSGKREFQKIPKLDRENSNIPNFYKSDQDWIFGNNTRTTSMSFEELPNLMHESITRVNSRINSTSTNSRLGLESRSGYESRNGFEPFKRGLGGGQLGSGLRLSPIMKNK